MLAGQKFMTKKHFDASTPGLIFTQQGQGFIWTIESDQSGVSGTAVIISSGGANQVNAWQFVLLFDLLISRITFEKGAVVVAGATANFGYYNSSKAKVVDSGPFDCSAGGAAVQTRTITPVLLPKGLYWYAQSASDSTVTCARSISGQGFQALSFNVNAPAASPRCGIGATPTVAGVMPASLGVMAGIQRTPAAIFFEP